MLSIFFWAKYHKIHAKTQVLRCHWNNRQIGQLKEIVDIGQYNVNHLNQVKIVNDCFNSVESTHTIRKEIDLNLMKVLCM